MKKIILLIAFFALIKPDIFSQQYIPIPDTLASWDCVFEDEENLPYLKLVKYESYGDTIINQLKYIKIFRTLKVSYFPTPYYPTLYSPIDTTRMLHGLLRNTNDGKVFVKYDTTEYLLYDFNLNINDSIKFNPNYPYFFYVVDCDSTLVNGVYRKRLSIEEKGGWDGRSYWIEGIGSDRGLFVNESINAEFYYHSLTCFKIDQNVLFSGGSGWSCFNFLTAIETENTHQNIEIYPLPVVDKSYIHIPEFFRLKCINIYDLNLRKTIQYSSGNNTEFIIDRNKLYTGMFFVEIIDMDGKKIMKKIVVK